MSKPTIKPAQLWLDFASAIGIPTESPDYWHHAGSIRDWFRDFKDREEIDPVSGRKESIYTLAGGGKGKTAKFNRLPLGLQNRLVDEVRQHYAPHLLSSQLIASCFELSGRWKGVIDPRTKKPGTGSGSNNKGPLLILAEAISEPGTSKEEVRKLQHAVMKWFQGSVTKTVYEKFVTDTVHGCAQTNAIPGEILPVFESLDTETQNNFRREVLHKYSRAPSNVIPQCYDWVFDWRRKKINQAAEKNRASKTPEVIPSREGSIDAAERKRKAQEAVDREHLRIW